MYSKVSWILGRVPGTERGTVQNKVTSHKDPSFKGKAVRCLSVLCQDNFTY